MRAPPQVIEPGLEWPMRGQEKDSSTEAPQVMADLEEDLGGWRRKDVCEVPFVPVFLECIGHPAEVEEALVMYVGS